MLLWSTWVCPGEDRVQRWHGCLGCGIPGGTRGAGKPVAMGTRDTALAGAFSSAQWQVHKCQPWLGFFYCPVAGASVWGDRGYNGASILCM